MGYHGSGSSLNSQIDGSEHGSDGKEPACNAGDSALIPGLERCPGEGNGYPLQHYWDVHKQSPSAWTGFKSPRFTCIWMILSGHHIIWNKWKIEQAINCLFLVCGALRAELSSVVAISWSCLYIINIFQQYLTCYIETITKSTHSLVTLAIFQKCP